jgi:hypothetical protein
VSDQIKLDLTCDCGAEFTQVLEYPIKPTFVKCPKCGHSHPVSQDSIENALDQAKENVWKNLGL